LKLETNSCIPKGYFGCKAPLFIFFSYKIYIRTHKITQNHTKSHKITQNHTKSHKITQNHTKSHKITQNHTNDKKIQEKNSRKEFQKRFESFFE
jgi:amino acid permease